MAEITRRRTGELLQKLFDILKQSPEGMPASTALQQLASSVQLSEYEAGNYAKGSRRFEKIVRFATVDCVKAGWLVKHKGTWALTEAGIEAHQRLTDPETFFKEASRLYRVWKKGRDVAEEDAADPLAAQDETEDADKSSAITFENAEEQSWGEIEAHVGTMDPYEVQGLVADLLKAMGYYPSWIAPPGKDGGVDIIAYADPLGSRPPRIKVQVKRQKERMNREAVSAFLSHVNEDDAGLCVCTGGFTRDASDFARMQERRKITLIDLEKSSWTSGSSFIQSSTSKLVTAYA